MTRDSRVYFGHWRKDSKQGVGLMIYDGLEYKGEWLNDKPHGLAMFIGEDKVEKYGVFENGVMTELRQDPGKKMSQIFNLGLHEQFLDLHMKKINEIDASINRKIKEMEDSRTSFQEEIHVKSQNLGSLMKELQNRVENSILSSESKLLVLKKEIKQADLNYILDNFHEANYGMQEEVRSKKRTETGGFVFDLSTRSPERPGSNRGSKQRRTSPVSAKFENRSEQKKRELDQINERLGKIFSRELCEEEVSEFRLEGSGQKPSKGMVNKEVQTRDEDEEETVRRFKEKLEEMEERERLLFLEKMNIKKQKEEILFLMEELEKSKHAKLAQDISSGPKGEDLDPEAIMKANGIDTKIEIDPFEELWRPFASKTELRDIQLSVGKEESRLLVYEDLDEVIVSDRHLLYRIKTFEDRPAKILNVKEFEASEQIIYLCDLNGRYVVVTLPLFKMHFVDLFDQVYHTIEHSDPIEPCLELPHTRILQLSVDSPTQLLQIDNSGGLHLIDKNSFVASKKMSLLSEEDSPKYELISVLTNCQDQESFSIFKIKESDYLELKAKSFFFLSYYNFETEFRFKYDASTFVSNVSHLNCMAFNYNKKLIFCGGSVSDTPHILENELSMYPVLFALETSGHTLQLQAEMKVTEYGPSQGIFTLTAHPQENVVFCTFDRHVLISLFKKNQFIKFRVLTNVSESVVYRSVLSRYSFFSFCSKSESLKKVEFPELTRATPTHELYSKFQVERFSYAIEEFKDDIKFVAVDDFLGVMFVFTNCVYKCIVTRKSLALDDKKIDLSRQLLRVDCYQAKLISGNRVVAFVNVTNELVVLDYNLNVLQRLEGVKGHSFSLSNSRSTISSEDDILLNWLKGNHQSALISVNSEALDEIERAPLFGTVNDFSNNIPLLSAYAKRNFCGLYYVEGKYQFSWKIGDGAVRSEEINKVFPEAQMMHSLLFSDCGKFIVCLFSSSKEATHSELILASFHFAQNFSLADYRRLPKLELSDFNPSVVSNKARDVLAVNLGTSVHLFETKEGRFDNLRTVSDISTDPIVDVCFGSNAIYCIPKSSNSFVRLVFSALPTV